MTFRPEANQGRRTFPSRDKTIPYLTVFCKRTERYDGAEVTATATSTSTVTPTVSYTSTCSWHANYVEFPMTGSIPGIFTGDGNSVYLSVKYGFASTPQTATYDTAALSPYISATSIGVINPISCWKIDAIMDLRDTCYSIGSANNKFNLGKNDFSIRTDVYMWYTPAFVDRMFFFKGYTSGVRVYRNDQKRLEAALWSQALGDNLFISTSFTLTTSAWYSIALSRTGNTLRLWTDGVERGSLSFSESLIGTGLQIGAASNAAPYYSTIRVSYRSSEY